MNAYPCVLMSRNSFYCVNVIHFSSIIVSTGIEIKFSDANQVNYLLPRDFKQWNNLLNILLIDFWMGKFTIDQSIKNDPQFGRYFSQQRHKNEIKLLWLKKVVRTLDIVIILGIICDTKSYNELQHKPTINIDFVCATAYPGDDVRSITWLTIYLIRSHFPKWFITKNFGIIAFVIYSIVSSIENIRSQLCSCFHSFT